MNIVKSVKEVVSIDKRQSNPTFSKLQKFYSEKLEKGIAIKKEYSIPPLDKQERQYYETCLSK